MMLISDGTETDSRLGEKVKSVFFYSQGEVSLKYN